MAKINTKQVEGCDKCHCITNTLMDENGNRFCGKCKKPKSKVLSGCICGKCDVSKVNKAYEAWLAEQQKEARIIENNL